MDLIQEDIEYNLETTKLIDDAINKYGKENIRYGKLNHFVMDHTLKMCNERFNEKVQESIKNSYIVFDGDEINLEEDGPTENIEITALRCLETAKKYKGEKVAVLDFANNHSVGGAPWHAGAQEESICRATTLFPCIDSKKEAFYALHTKQFDTGIINNLGNDDLIYVPNVLVFKSDESIPKMLEESEYYNVDIIVCAAPQITFDDVIDKNYEVLIEKRIRKIIKVAKRENVDVLVLGAFGCGAFHNPPDIVAKAFKKALQEYNFKKVVFSIGCRDGVANEKYEIFNNTFKK